MELLEQKVEELEKAQSAGQKDSKHAKKIKELRQKHLELAEDCEATYERYSTLAKDCLILKQREAESFDNYINACQEKEKLAVDSKMEISHQRMKIKLLQEALTKRNQEFEALQKKHQHLVSSP